MMCSIEPVLVWDLYFVHLVQCPCSIFVLICVRSIARTDLSSDWKTLRSLGFLNLGLAGLINYLVTIMSDRCFMFGGKADYPEEDWQECCYVGLMKPKVADGLGQNVYICC